MEHGSVVVQSRKFHKFQATKAACTLSRNGYRKIVHMHDFSVATPDVFGACFRSTCRQDAGAPGNGG
jgi:hypothetical protein